MKHFTTNTENIDSYIRFCKPRKADKKIQDFYHETGTVFFVCNDPLVFPIVRQKKNNLCNDDYPRSGKTMCKKQHRLPQSLTGLGTMRAQLNTPLKPTKPYATVMSEGFQGALIVAP